MSKGLLRHKSNGMVALGSCTFVLFPFLGIFITIVFWTLKKDKIQAIDRLGKELRILNYFL
jgi:uncharacterized Tic20 family protein